MRHCGLAYTTTLVKGAPFGLRRTLLTALGRAVTNFYCTRRVPRAKNSGGVPM